MRWKTFFQIIFLVLIVAAVFYVVFPKYDMMFKSEKYYVRYNKITGKTEEAYAVLPTATTKWIVIKNEEPE